VFAGRAHQRYDATRPVTSFQTGWNRVRREAKVSARFHDLRHTLITKLCESGAGEETIRAIAGHMSRRMLSRYAHIRTEAKRRALESIVRPVETIPVEQPDQASESVAIN
jgi:integrase